MWVSVHTHVRVSVLLHVLFVCVSLQSGNTKTQKTSLGSESVLHTWRDWSGLVFSPEAKSLSCSLVVGTLRSFSLSMSQLILHSLYLLLCKSGYSEEQLLVETSVSCSRQ